MVEDKKGEDKKQKCKDVKNLIQEYFDNNTPLPGWANAHLVHCIGCCTFKHSLTKFILEVKADIDNEVESMGEVDFSILPDKHLQDKHSILLKNHLKLSLLKLLPRTLLRALPRVLPRVLPRALPLAAVILFFVFGAMFGYKSYITYKARSFFKQENKIFVERIFNRPLFEIENISGEMILPSDWFQTTDIPIEINNDFLPL